MWTSTSHRGLNSCSSWHISTTVLFRIFGGTYILFVPGPISSVALTFCLCQGPYLRWHLHSLCARAHIFGGTHILCVPGPISSVALTFCLCQGPHLRWHSHSVCPRAHIFGGTHILFVLGPISSVALTLFVPGPIASLGPTLPSVQCVPRAVSRGI